jgi:hypothetical protein
MTAKVDSAAVQDGYQLYHHAFFFTREGHWCVVQQGMSDASRTARRYHWLSDALASYVNEPHQAICSDVRGATLNLVSAEHASIRDASVALASGPPAQVMTVVQRYVHEAPRSRVARRHTTPRLPFDASTSTESPESFSSGDHRAPTLEMPSRHALLLQDVDPRHLRSVLLSTYDRAPRDFEALLGLPGVGGRTLRALALVSEVIYGTPASMRDPARFAFAHGGKDGTPFPVDRATYDRTIDTLHRAMARAHIDRSEKIGALKRLSQFAKSTEPVRT